MPKITKAILTGGGRATRLRPITTTINKHLIQLANKPMIFHAIEKVVRAGVTEIFINTNPGESELQKAIGDGDRWGIKITFFEQEGGPQGIAHVVKQAQKFIGDDPFMFYLSDNIILAELDSLVEKFSSGGYDCMLALSKVNDPERFGVPVFNEKSELVEVWEKPKNPPNNFAVTGIYIYGPKLFFDAFEHIEKSPRGEYEISDIHSYLLKIGRKVGYEEITGWWKDTGKPEDLILANNLLLDQLGDEHYKINCACPPDITCSGKVYVGAGTKIGKEVVISGPAIIGENCELEKCMIAPYTTIGSGSVVKLAKIQDSIIFENCQINCPIKIGNSLIGKSANVVQDEHTDFHRLIIGDQTIVEI